MSQRIGPLSITVLRAGHVMLESSAMTSSRRYVGELAHVLRNASFFTTKAGSGRVYLRFAIGDPYRPRRTPHDEEAFVVDFGLMAETRAARIERRFYLSLREPGAARQPSRLAWGLWAAVLSLCVATGVLALTAMAVLGLFKSFFGGIDTSAPPRPQPALTRPVPAVPRLSRLSLQNVHALAPKVGIAMHTNRTILTQAVPFYIFSRPDGRCEDCARIVAQAQATPAPYLPILMPAGLDGDMASALRVGLSYCSATPDVSWEKWADNLETLKRLPKPEQRCKWMDRARVSDMLVKTFNVPAKAWPMVVAPNGRVHYGAWPDAQGLRLWLLDNTH